MKNNEAKLFMLAILWGAMVYGASGIAATRKLQWNGSGCPKSEESDSAEGTLQATRQVGETFQIKRGPGVRIVENRKQCTLIVSAAEGKVQFALEKIELNGKGPPGFGSKDELEVDVTVQGQSQAKTLVFDEAKGDPSDVNFKKVRTVPDSELQWSPCDRGLSLNTKAKLDGKGNAGAPLNAAIDSIAFTFRTKPCGK